MDPPPPTVVEGDLELPLAVRRAAHQDVEQEPRRRRHVHEVAGLRGACRPGDRRLRAGADAAEGRVVDLPDVVAA
jgi:hypothetical protein